jgi:hypothetical protein
MTSIFIGGSRSITRLSSAVHDRIDRMIARRFPVLVGDANGADKAVQRYLHSQRYDLVEVYCTGEECRNNVGGWRVRSVEHHGSERDFSFYAAKDGAMAQAATHGLMIWDKKSVGTLMNVLRLVSGGKPTVIYLAPDRRFVDVKNMVQWDTFVSGCASDVRRRLERKASSWQVTAVASRQAGLF